VTAEAAARVLDPRTFPLLEGDAVITLGGGKVHFDAENRFPYLAAKGGELFLVEEMIHN
jgi:hypothetical protein